MAKITTTLFENLKTQSVTEGKTGNVSTQYLDPTDLLKPGDVLACALGACMMTMVGAVAAKRKEDLTGSRLEIEPEFNVGHTRVTGFKLAFTFPDGLTEETKEFYAKAAQTCPVHNSLKEDIVYAVTIK